MSAKLLIFEFNKLLTALEVHRAMEPMGVEVMPVPRKHYNKTLEAILDPWSEIYDEDAEPDNYTGAPLGCQMAVLCELNDQLDEVLTALRGAGVGADCLKAVLTDTNEGWTPLELYQELCREQDAFRGK